MPYKDKKNRLCGFLNKEDDTKHKTFVRRYFMLDYAAGQLNVFYDSPLNLPKSERKPCLEIYLNMISKVSDAKEQRPKVANCFAIDYVGSQLFMQADDKEDMNEWIEKLDDACKVTIPEEERPRKSKEHLSSNVEMEKREVFRTEVVGGVAVKFSSSSWAESDDECRSGEHGWPANQIPSILSGYAVKQGAKRKNWKRRFFVFTMNGLSYYKSEQDRGPIKTVEIEEITEARLVGGIHHAHRENLFEVVTPKRIFYMQCETPEESHKWIDAINKQCQTHRSVNSNATKEAAGPTLTEDTSDELHIDKPTETMVAPQSNESETPPPSSSMLRESQETTTRHNESIHEEIKPSKTVWETTSEGQTSADRRSKVNTSNRHSKKSWLNW